MGVARGVDCQIRTETAEEWTNADKGERGSDGEDSAEARLSWQGWCGRVRLRETPTPKEKRVDPTWLCD